MTPLDREPADAHESTIATLTSPVAGATTEYKAAVSRVVHKNTTPQHADRMATRPTAEGLRKTNPLHALCVVAYHQAWESGYGEKGIEKALHDTVLRAAFPDMHDVDWNHLERQCLTWLRERKRYDFDHELYPPVHSKDPASWTALARPGAQHPEFEA